MPVFVSTTFATDGSSVYETVKVLAERNILNIELGSTHKYENDLHSKLIGIGGNYITHNFFPPINERLVLNIASTDERIRHKSLQFMRHAIDFAERIGAGIYTIHPGFLIDPTGESRTLKNYDFDFSSISSPITSSDYKKCFKIFINSLNEISSYVENKHIIIAVETQGSVSKKDFVIFSKPEDFSTFLSENQNPKIGINLNLAHLHLASNAWRFDMHELVETLKSRIVAVEVSHNNGVEDEHQALRPNTSYMSLLRDNFFKHVPVIFEGRNLSIDEVVLSYDLLRNNLE